MGCGASKPVKDEPPEPRKGAPPTLESEPSAGERCHTDNPPPPCDVAEGEAAVEAAAEDEEEEEEEGANIDPATGEVKRSNSVVEAYAGSSFQEQLAALQAKCGGASESPLEAAIAAHAESAAEPEAAADEDPAE